MGEHKVMEEIVVEVRRNDEGVVVVLFVVAGFQTAVQSPSSKPKYPVADTCWVWLASTRRCQPSQNAQASNTVIRGSEGV
jgi:hypothetical protein